MKARAAARLAWGLWAVSLTGWAGAAVIGVRYEIPDFTPDTVGGAAIAMAFAAYPTVGAIVASRRPGNAMGWLFLSIGVLIGVGALGWVYSEYAIGIQGEHTALGVAGAWVASWFWYPTLGLTFLFTLLLFPDGRVPSRRWRPLAYVAAVALAAMTVLAALAERIEGSTGFSIDNPVGIPGLGYVEDLPVGAVLFIVYGLCQVGAILSLIVRFRRSRGDERQQLKWFVYGGAVMVLVGFVEELFPGVTGDSDLAFAITISLLPIAMGVAIMKYRLYDLDRIINRTLVYSALSALLVLVYVAGVVGLGAILQEITQQENNSLAVAASTLVVAALFRPARSRIQGFIDRRFYRRRYDATKTLEAFSARLRDEVELDSLTTDLLGVIRETVQPIHASLWLRDAQEVRR
jgi:hypothetical protein